VLADVVPVATALHDLEEFVVGDHLAALLVEGGEDPLCGQRQIDPLAAPPGRSLAQRVEGEFFADRQAGFAGVAIARGAQDLQEGVDEIGLGEGGLLQVIPGIERLHDAAVDGRRHRRDDQHRRAAGALVDGVDDRDAGMTLATEFDIEHHQVVVLAGDGRFGLVAGEPLLDGDSRLGREDPLLELMAGGRIVFDDRDLEHGAFSRTA
jgi:hypothetical protein